MHKIYNSSTTCTAFSSLRGPRQTLAERHATFPAPQRKLEYHLKSPRPDCTASFFFCASSGETTHGVLTFCFGLGCVSGLNPFAKVVSQRHLVHHGQSCIAISCSPASGMFGISSGIECTCKVPMPQYHMVASTSAWLLMTSPDQSVEVEVERRPSLRPACRFCYRFYRLARAIAQQSQEWPSRHR